MFQTTNLHCVIFKSPKQHLETYCFCSVSYYYYYYSCSCSCSCYSPFFPCTMNLSTADLRNYRTEFHETWWSYRYMFLVDPKVFRFVVKGVKSIFLGIQRGWGLLQNPMGNQKFCTLMLITSKWINDREIKFDIVIGHHERSNSVFSKFSRCLPFSKWLPKNGIKNGQ